MRGRARASDFGLLLGAEVFDLSLSLALPGKKQRLGGNLLCQGACLDR